jgi:hypothetical protein
MVTDQANHSVFLVSPALRRAPGSVKDPVPVLVLERFATFDGSNLATRLARGKDLILFDGFQVDLDSGQVVPEEQGGDLRFRVGPDGPGLEAVGMARLYTLSRAPLPAAGSAAAPSLGRSVLARDFAGRYRLFANGQWSGTLDLKVDGAGAVSGRFRSDTSGAAYGLTGQVSTTVPHKVTFRVKLPRTQQDYEGFLWTEGKGALAGTLTMLDQSYGFFALREGGRFGPEGEEVGPVARGAQAGAPGRRTVVLRKGEYTLDGQPRTDQELTDALRRSLEADPQTWVLLQVPEDERFAAIDQAFAVIGAAGIRTIRLAPSGP